MSRGERKAMVARGHPDLSLSRQCEILSISRSSFSDTPKGESPETLVLRRVVPQVPVLRQPSDMARQLRRDGVLVGRQRVRRLDAAYGVGGDLHGAEDQRAASRAPDLSLSSQGTGDRSAGSCVVRRHHLHPGAARIFGSGRNHRLGHASRASLAAVEHARCPVLRRGPERSAGSIRPAGNLQHRPGQPVQPASTSRARSARRRSRSPWTAEGAAWTTSSSNGSSTRRSTCTS